MSQLSLLVGDCRVLLAGLKDASVDACVTDPPYELGFMGKKWDASGVSFDPDTWRAVLRVLKPGAHLVAFGGTRTFHRMVCAIEDAGFEIRDQIDWLYGTGFPKSLNLGDGRGTALKPAHEPICLARKPLVGTLAVNVKRFGTGALNIDACRIDFASGRDKELAKPGTTPPSPNGNGVTHGAMTRVEYVQPAGRWPANVILDEAAAAMLDEQSGARRSAGQYPSDSESRGAASTSLAPTQGRLYADTGGASRFFYVAKPSRRERDAGLDHLAPKSGAEATDSADGAARLNSPRTGAGRTGGARNHHPTVKPIALMRHLVRLVTPPGGLVLDPFTGSGTTGIAAAEEGMRFIGVELSEEYAEIARGRIAAGVQRGAK